MNTETNLFNKKEENEGGIKIINLEQDFKKEEGNENEDLNVINNNNNNAYHSQETNKNKNEVIGKWIKTGIPYYDTMLEYFDCSNCGESSVLSEPTNIVLIAVVNMKKRN